MAALWVDDWNEYNVKICMSNNWRASLVPAAAVIPAPRVYTKAVAVKKLVVNFLWAAFCLSSDGRETAFFSLSSWKRKITYLDYQRLLLTELAWMVLNTLL